MLIKFFFSIKVKKIKIVYFLLNRNIFSILTIFLYVKHKENDVCILIFAPWTTVHAVGLLLVETKETNTHHAHKYNG